MPRYGNYCGPGPDLDVYHRKNIPIPTPINAIDSACKDHDNDYDNCKSSFVRGFPLLGNDCTKEADRKFVEKLKKLIDSDELSPREKKIATVIASYFSLKDPSFKKRFTKIETVSFKEWVSITENYPTLVG